MRIFQRMRKVPSGLLLIPMLITALINTFLPGLLRLGGVTTALFSPQGTLVILGLLLFILGSLFRVQDMGKAFKRGGVISAGHIIIGWLSAFLVMRFFGPAGFLGIPAAAIATAMVSCYPGIYLALMEQYGDEIDLAAFSLLYLVAMPMFPLLFMEAVSGGRLDYMNVITTMIPFLLGMLLGNLDPDIPKITRPGLPLLLPFLGFCFGSSVNLMAAARSGLSGLGLTALFLLVNVPCMLLIDRLILRRPGYAATATCSVAGISVAVPALLAKADPAHLPYVETAAAQLALAFLLTSLITPFITKIIAQRFGSARQA